VIYDVIIIGAGVAGLSCAIKLRQLGKTCLVIEKSSLSAAKACGGGITNKALSLLSALNIHTSEFLNNDAKIITKSKQFFSDGSIKVFDYSKQPTAVKYSIGIQRNLFDTIMLNHALEAGVEIVKDYNARKIYASKYVHVDDYIGKKLVYATGASLNTLIHSEKCIKTLGMSMNVAAEMDLSDNVYYFYIDKDYCGGYAWVFPNGTDKWNVGVWQKNDFMSLRKNFENFYTNTFMSKIKHLIHEEIPKSGYIYCGNSEIYKKQNNIYYIGECTGFASEQNGEGIYHAIFSGTSAANEMYCEL